MASGVRCDFALEVRVVRFQNRARTDAYHRRHIKHATNVAAIVFFIRS